MPNPLNPIFRQPRESSQKRTTGLARRGSLKKTKIKTSSKKRVVSDRVYSDLRKWFLGEHPFCQWHIKELGFSEKEVIAYEGHMNSIHIPRSSEIHHTRKPRATYQNDVTTWLAVSREGHDAIEGDKKTARLKGYLL